MTQPASTTAFAGAAWVLTASVGLCGLVTATSPARAQYVAGGAGGSAGPSADHGLQWGGGGFVGGGNPYQGGSGGGGASDQAGSPGASDGGGSGGHGGKGGTAGGAGAIGPVTSGLGSPLPSGSIAGAAGGQGNPGGAGDKGVDFGKAGRAGGGGGGGGGGALGWQSGFGTTVTGIGQQISGGAGGAGGAGGTGGNGILSYWIYMNLAQPGGAGGGGGGGGGGGPGIVDHGWLTIATNGLVTGGAGGKGGNGGISGISYGGTGDGIPTCTYTEFGVSCTDFPSLPANPGHSGSGGSGGSGGYGILGLKLGSTNYAITTQAGATVRGGDGGDGGNGSVGGEIAGNGGSGGNGGGGIFLDDGFWIDNSGTIAGGNGGRGGNGGGGLTAGNGANGGDGGDGVLVTNGTVSNAAGASIAGGNGGAAGKGAVVTHGTSGSDGAAGNGGAGVRLQGGPSITNFGTIAGGNAGAGSTTARGGSGILSFGSTTVVNDGTISGGLNGDGTRAPALILHSAMSALELRAGSNIVGDVLAGFAPRLIFGGDQNSSFDLSELGRKYKSFPLLVKTGLSTWTLSGTPHASNKDVDVEGGILALTAGARLLTYGDGYINRASGPSAEMRVAGANASWEVSNAYGDGGGITVGDTSSGSLTVAAGGKVRAMSVTAGDKAGGDGSVTVTGAGSNLTADAITIGLSGTGVLTVSDGASVSPGASGWIDVARNAGSSGTVNIGAAAGQAAVAPGSLAGDIRFGAGSGALIFNHIASNYSFSRTISGAGSIRFLSGTTTLTGNSAGFTGATTVETSTFRIAQGAQLGGTLAIGAGGRVEGEGRIGATTIGNGGTLAPGGATSLTIDGGLTANAGGTLALGTAAPLLVNGDLTLNAGSFVEYRLPATLAGITLPGSSAVQVSGDLALNGALLNIGIASSSAQPAIGYQRLFTYAGTLSGNLLPVGSTPATTPIAYSYQIDTTRSGVVDLLVQPNGLNILQLWGTTSSGGGTGIWNAGNANWLDLGGSVPASWGSGYSVFRGPGGVVTIDGPQSAVGLQFAGGSYTLAAGAGGSLNLHGFSSGGFSMPVPEISVLAGETATISAPITGSDGLAKTGDGTLILNGASSYGGGTTIAGGVLQIAGDGNLGAASGGLTFQNGSLHTTADILSARNVTFSGSGSFDTDAGTTLRLSGNLGGVGGLLKWGDGTLALSGSNSWTGGTLISAGTIRAESAGALPSSTGYVLTGGKLDLNGFPLSMSLLAGTGGEVALGSGDLTVNQAQDSVFAGAITGSGMLTKAGTGTLLLTGTNSHGGGTSVIGGTLAITSDANLGAASAQLLIGSRLASLANIDSARPIILQGSGTIDTLIGTTFKSSGAVLGDHLIKEGGGTLVLAGDAAHAGGTTIAAGMLQVGDGGTSGTLAGPVVNDSLLSFNRSDNLTFAGTISGLGTVVQAGSGITTLTAANSHTGGTVILAGTLQVSADANLGAAGAPLSFFGGSLRFGAGFILGRALLLAGNGTLDTNGFDATASGGIYGVGDLIKTGAGTLTLAGPNFYRNTIVRAGTLIGDALSIRGDIANDGTVILDQHDDADLAGAISGTGALIKAGAGFLELTGNSAGFTGATTVAAGTLAVNGTLGGTLDVLSGSRLQGSGTVGATTIRAGATVAPGNSIGTLTVTGDVSFQSGAIYEVEVNPEGTQSDLIHATGAAHLGGGAVIHVGQDGFYKPFWRYRILTADGGVTGRFDGVSSRFLFLDPTLAYDANGVDLTLVRNDLPFAAVAQTRNQIQTSLGLEGLSYTNPLWQRFTQLQDAGIARQAYDSLSGEIHASAKTTLVEGAAMVRDAVGDRIRAVFAGIGAPRLPTMAYASSDSAVSAPAEAGLAAWARGFGSWGRTEGNGNAASLKRSTGGIVTGIDSALGENARIGVVAGYSRSTFSVPGRASSGEADSYHLGLYGGARFDRLRLSGGLSYTGHDISTWRLAAFPGFSERLTAGYGARTLQAVGEAGYRFDLGRFAIEPFANLAYLNLRTDTIREQGGVAALFAKSQASAVTFATLGLRAQMQFDLAGTAATLNGTLGWRHAAGDVTPVSLQGFAGGAPFSIAGIPIARDAMIVGAGLGARIGQNAELDISYLGQLAKNAADHTFNAKLAVTF